MLNLFYTKKFENADAKVIRRQIDNAVLFYAFVAVIIFLPGIILNKPIYVVYAACVGTLSVFLYVKKSQLAAAVLSFLGIFPLINIVKRIGDFTPITLIVYTLLFGGMILIGMQTSKGCVHLKKISNNE